MLILFWNDNPIENGIAVADTLFNALECAQSWAEEAEIPLDAVLEKTYVANVSLREGSAAFEMIPGHTARRMSEFQENEFRPPPKPERD